MSVALKVSKNVSIYIMFWKIIINIQLVKKSNDAMDELHPPAVSIFLLFEQDMSPDLIHGDVGG